MARAPGRIDGDVVRQIFCPLFGKTKVHQKIRNIFLVGFSSRISLRHDLIKLRLGVRATRTKAVVPNVKRLKRSPQARLDQLAHLQH